MRPTTLTLLLLLLSGCVQNPVTGKRNLQFFDAEWERQAGASMYAPMRQSQGGDLVIDSELVDYVRGVGNRLAAHSRRGGELEFEFNVLNESTPNAWALPGGKISINRGLLTELESEAELAAVLGHEIIHADASHAARQQSKGTLAQLGAVASLILIDSTVDSTSGKQAAAMVPVLGAQLLTQRYSRDAEREADEYGMRYMSEAGYDPQGAVRLQETFVRLSEGRDEGWLSGLFASHPPSRDRVERNRKTARQLPEGGEVGQETYRQKTAFLIRVAPAYEAYDAAIQAASSEDYETARAELDKALKIEPRESLFHALDGDLKEQAGQQQLALEAYDRAVARYDAFFYHHLRRGQLYFEAGQATAARTDLERSVELLPTAVGHYLLGNLDRDAGDLEAARQHWGQAAQSGADAGLAAERELVLLDIGDAPGQFVATTAAADADGRVFCLLGNRTRLEIDGIRVAASFVDDGGSTREQTAAYSQALPGGERAGVSMGWRTADAGSLQDRMHCTVQAARVAGQEGGG